MITISRMTNQPTNEAMQDNLEHAIEQLSPECKAALKEAGQRKDEENFWRERCAFLVKLNKELCRMMIDVHSNAFWAEIEEKKNAD